MHPLHNPLFVQFIVYFNKNQDYFECHEVLEEYWKSLPTPSKDHPLTAYILLATGLYHFRRGNTAGAFRTLRKAQTKLATPSKELDDFTDGIDFKQLGTHLEQTIQSLNEKQPFKSFPIVILSKELSRLVEKMEPTMDLLLQDSNDVIHKHMLRDRSDILRMRDEKKKGRI